MRYLEDFELNRLQLLWIDCIGVFYTGIKHLTMKRFKTTNIK